MEGWETEQNCIEKYKKRPRHGFIGDSSGDTRACRVYHLGKAMVSAGDLRTAHCDHASFNGATFCEGDPASTPASFCAQYASTCFGKGGEGAAAWDKDRNLCIKDVGMLISGPAKVSTILGAQKGNTFHCRAFYLMHAQNSDTGVTGHCSSASSTGRSVEFCSKDPSAANFCAQYEDTCGSGWTTCVTDFNSYQVWQ